MAGTILPLSSLGLAICVLLASSCEATLVRGYASSGDNGRTDGAVASDAHSANSAGSPDLALDRGPSDTARPADHGSPQPADSGSPQPADSGSPCTALTAEAYENNEGNNAEFTAKFFPTGNRDDEYIDMFFRSSTLGTHSYGVGKNADLYTCTQCMLVVRNKKVFYPTQGTITIGAGSQPMKKRLFATLSKLTLIEITISGSYHSIPVPKGECITLAPATISVN